VNVPYAEVIGDPIAQSKSPVIHRFWLEKLGMEGDYRRAHVKAAELESYLGARRDDADWRGCNVTIPHKQRVLDFVKDASGACSRIGAANVVLRSALGELSVANTDVEGVRAALDVPDTLGNQVCVIGAGGAARALLEFLRQRETMEVSFIVRDPAKADGLRESFGLSGGIYTFENCDSAIAGAEWVINASPLGMGGMPAMPDRVLDSLNKTEEYALVLDMVYFPVETRLLRRARQLRRHTSDGLTMLIGQADSAFRLFFGAEAPREHDAELRALLTS
jgi:shikimate dehydrogenase